MEWMLQVIDELDDLISALRLCFVGMAAELGLVAAGGLGLGAIGAAIAAGAEVTLICSAAVVLSLAAALKLQESQNWERTANNRRREPPLL
jgi:D-arabinose 1-dehydrogenase-like Zn-dependent alcohol dehydrogenase